MPLVKRLVKGTELTYAEGDGNLDWLESDRALRLLEQKGAVFSGAGSAAADTAAIQDLIDEYEALSDSTSRKAKVRLPHSSEIGGDAIYLNAGLTIDISKCGGIIGNGCQLNFANAADGIDYLTVTGTSTVDYPLYSQEITYFKDFSVVGNGKAGTSRAFVFDGSGSAGPNRALLSSVFVEDVGTGFYFADYAYLVKAEKVSVGRATTCIVQANAGASGELMVFSNGTFFESTNVLQADSAGAQYVFMHSSFDFNTQSVVASTGRISLIGCNIEGTYTSDPWFELTSGAANGVLRLTDCDLTQNTTAPTSIPACFDIAASWKVYVDRPWLHNWLNTDQVLAIGAGRIFVSGHHSFSSEARPAMLHMGNSAANMLVDGGFESAALNEADANLTNLLDTWQWIGNHPYKISTGEVYVTNDDAYAGSQCMAVKMIGANVSAGQRTLRLIKPVDPGASYVFSCRAKKSSGGSGTFSISGRWLNKFDPSSMGSYLGSVTWDVPNLASGAVATSSGVTITGVAIGDKVTVYPTLSGATGTDLAGVDIVGQVSATNTVTLYAHNRAAGAVDLNVGLTIYVERGLGEMMPYYTLVGSQSQFYVGSAITPSSSAWSNMQFFPAGNQPPAQAPDWARAIEVSFEFAAMNHNGGYVYIDDVWLQMWSAR